MALVERVGIRGRPDLFVIKGCGELLVPSSRPPSEVSVAVGSLSRVSASGASDSTSA